VESSQGHITLSVVRLSEHPIAFASDTSPRLEAGIANPRFHVARASLLSRPLLEECSQAQSSQACMFTAPYIIYLQALFDGMAVLTFAVIS
jgi:hypothetical protein